SLDNTVTNVPPQSFFDHGFETRAGAGGTFRKGVKIGGKCRTPVASIFSMPQLYQNLFNCRVNRNR
ncbi:hypothetical protein, partial [Parazoarcus communis]|uniref:hypothetical protein n=1 Tax=Parazoarcus communis TaxID=41977 RepID=UPI001B7D05CB